EDAGADGALDVLAAARLDDDGVDAVAVQQRGQQQACGAGPDDGDAGAGGLGHVAPWSGVGGGRNARGVSRVACAAMREQGCAFLHASATPLSLSETSAPTSELA